MEVQHAGSSVSAKPLVPFEETAPACWNSDAEGSGAIMSLAWSPSCLALCPLPCHRDKLWTAQAVSILDGSLPHQESRTA